MASVAKCHIIFFRKKQRTIKRKKRSHKCRGLATCRRIKSDAMSLSNCDRAARNSSNVDDSSPIVVLISKSLFNYNEMPIFHTMSIRFP